MRISNARFKKIDLHYRLEIESSLQFKSRYISVANHTSKSVSQLWEEIEEALQSGIDKYIPKKTLCSKPSLPWMTQDIRRNIRKRERAYHLSSLSFSLSNPSSLYYFFLDIRDLPEARFVFVVNDWLPSKQT